MGVEGLSMMGASSAPSGRGGWGSAGVLVFFDMVFVAGCSCQRRRVGYNDGNKRVEVKYITEFKTMKIMKLAADCWWLGGDKQPPGGMEMFIRR
jgi:hypothetical protein